MGVYTGPGNCPYCQKEVMMACSTMVDLAHLALTLLTGGLWGLVWMYSLQRARACVCCRCGRVLPRARPNNLARLRPETSLPSNGSVRSQSEFNRILVAHNLVYYVPTSARY